MSFGASQAPVNSVAVSGGSAWVTSIPPFPEGELAIVSIGTFGAASTGLAVTDDVGGVWFPYISGQTIPGTVQITTQSFFGVFAKYVTGHEEALTLHFGGSPTTVWNTIDVIGGGIGQPSVDPNWASVNGKTLFENFSTSGVKASGDTTPTGQSPIASGLSHQAKQVIYAVGFTPRGNGGLNSPPWPSNSANFPNLTPLNNDTSGTQDLNTAWTTSTAQFSSTDTFYQDWSGGNARAAVVFAISFFDPGPVSIITSPARFYMRGGHPSSALALPEVGNYTLESTFSIGGGLDGALVDCYRVSRFAQPPQLGDQPPSGGGDQVGGQVESGGAGSSGRWSLPIAAIADYYVRVLWKGVNYWGKYSAGSICGQPPGGLVLSNSSAAVGPLVVNAPAPVGNTTSPEAAAIGHGHDLASAFTALGEMFAGAGPGEAARTFLPTTQPVGQVWTILPTTPPAPGWSQPVGGLSIQPISTVPSPAISQPGEYTVTASAPYIIPLPPLAVAPFGLYSFDRVDTSEFFVGFRGNGGDQIDVSTPSGFINQFGFMHHGDRVVFFPDPNRSIWRIAYFNPHLGNMYMNQKFMSAFGDAGYYGFMSPGPFSGAALDMITGSGNSWQARITVGGAYSAPWNGFVFFGTDVTDLAGFPRIQVTSGSLFSGGPVAVLAVGHAGGPNNQSGIDLAPNQAIVGAYIPGNYNPPTGLPGSTSTIAVTGGTTGSIAFDDRRQPIDCSSNITPQLATAPFDGRYSFADIVLPPSGVFETTASGDMSILGNWQGGGDSASDQTGPMGWSLFACPDLRDGTGNNLNPQDVWDVRGTVTAMIHPQFANSHYNRYVAVHWGQTKITQGQTITSTPQSPFPGGYPCRVWWTTSCDEHSGSASHYGDGNYWRFENVPPHMSVRAINLGGTVNGTVG